MLHYKVRSICEKQAVKSWVREKGKQVEKGRVCMIYTVTLNPSLDYTMKLEKFRSGSLNRAASEQIMPGGKGINVSTVLANLGCPSVALGFLAGFTGEEIERRLRQRGIQTEFLYLKEGVSRINVKLWEETETGKAEETEINGSGPQVTPSELEVLLERFGRLQTGDVLVLAGSVPSGLPDTIYQDICKNVQGNGVRLVVDAAGSLLERVLPYHPFLIKPNQYELGELFGVSLQSRKDVIPYAKKLQERGAVHVLVSMGGEGAVFVGENGVVYESPAPEGTVLGTIGAGDSRVAGVLAGFLKTEDYQEAFLTGLCAGSASAFSDTLATAEEVAKIRRGLQYVDFRRESGL